ncbi:MAG: signal peptidase I [Coriobacteriales bacterium]
MAGKHAKKSALGAFLEFVVIVAMAAVIAWVVVTFVVQPYEIPSESMTDTIEVGDRVLSEKVSYHFEDPKQGDIITFHDVEDYDRILIKRVIAVGGQTVDLKNGDVYVDGEKLDESYTEGKPSYPLESETGEDIQYPYTVPEGEVWVMGDNRTNSMDSRAFGSVPVSNITGHAVVRYWPLDRIGSLD